MLLPYKTKNHPTLGGFSFICMARAGRLRQRGAIELKSRKLGS
jgi:hypothetical protein